MQNRWIIPPPADMIEPAVAPVIYSSGQPAVEWLGNGNICIHLPQRQLPLEAVNGNPQTILAARLIKPIAELPLMLMTASQCLSWHLCQHAPVCPVCPERPPRNIPPRVVS